MGPIVSLDYALLRLAVTFLSMGAWVSVIAVATERRGGKFGGFLVGIPSTAALSFFFTGLFVSPATAVSATNAFPIFLSLTGFFLLCFGYTARRGFATGIIVSTSIWFLVSFLVVGANPDNFALSLVSCVGISAATYYIFRRRLKPKSPAKIRLRYTWTLLLLRFVLSGSVVTLAVFMGQIGIPILSGMLAAFPALAVSALIAVRMSSRSEGTEYARGMTMSMMVSIMLIIVPYSMAVHYLYPSFGIGYGTIVSYAVAIIIGVLYYVYAEDFLVPHFADKNQNGNLGRYPSGVEIS